MMNPLVPSTFDVVFSILSVLALVLAVMAIIDLIRTPGIKASSKLLIGLAVVLLPLLASSVWLILRWKQRRSASVH